MILWRASSTRFWHFTAMSAVALLGISNLVFWPIFAYADMVNVGYLATSGHWIFAVLELAAGIATLRQRAASVPALGL